MEIDCWLKGRKMTNFEKIRQLSEEEMAKYIFDLEMGLREIPYCQGNDRCSYLMDSGREVPESMCMEPLENIYFPEYNEDPLACDHFPEGFEILRDYLEPVKKEKKKKSFFGKKRG